MGRVWQAWDERLRRNVAIKELIPPDKRGTFIGGESDPAARRMLREARAAAKLRHPGIVTVHDVVTDEYPPWIVMELIEGRSLANCLRDDGPLPVHRAAEIGIKVIEALDAAHQQGVLHRDVKPGNIMLDADRVVLTDFGIAFINEATVLTGAGQYLGTPEYMAPECLDDHKASPASDLWSAGITLYCMVVGRTPFRRAETAATWNAITNREPDPDPGVGSLWQVVQGLLRKKPPERLTAPAAVALLREVLGKSAPQPPAPLKLPTISVPTQIDDKGSQATVTNPTMYTTRTAMPRWLPSQDTQPVFGPGAPTLAPHVVVPEPNRRTWMIVASVGVAAFLAVIAIVVLVTANHGTGGSATQTSSRTSPVAPPLPVFQDYQESLGFSIAVPQGYVRQASAVSALSDVVWQATQRDPRIGALVVQVQRDDTQPGARPIDYLSAQDKAESVDGNDINYQRLSLTGQGNGPAVLEYTHGDPASGDQFHIWSRAVASGKDIYVLTFSLYAQDMPTLDAQWRAAQPVVAKIRDSFHITP